MSGVQIGTPGFRTRQITLLTTLLEAAVYQGDDLAELYRQRWQLETSLAYLKTTMRWRWCTAKRLYQAFRELGRVMRTVFLANCVIFHNVHAQTRILHQLTQEGQTIDTEALARLSPYLTAHVNRLGRSTLNFDRHVPSPDYTMQVGKEAA